MVEVIFDGRGDFFRSRSTFLDIGCTFIMVDNSLAEILEVIFKIKTKI